MEPGMCGLVFVVALPQLLRTFKQVTTQWNNPTINTMAVTIARPMVGSHART